MREFYTDRQKRHQKQLNKYLKYVFNDHIGLVLIFVLGGGMFYYSQFLERVDKTFILGKMIVALIWLVGLSVGKLATLLVEADAHFLLPKEDEMSEYFQAAFRHSLKIPSVLIGVLVVGAMPLLMRLSPISWYQAFIYFFNLMGLKMIHMSLLIDRLYKCDKHATNQQPKFLFHWLVSLATVLISTFFYSWLGSVLILIYAMMFFYYEKREKKETFNWLLAIELEQTRQKRIASMMNMFTDVPNVATPIRRRRYLDGLIARYTRRYTNTFDFLYIRSFLRGTSYLGVTFRLVVIGIVSGLFIDDWRLLLPLFLVIIFAIGFQLVPLYQHYDYQTMTQLYPIAISEKKQALQRLWKVVLVSVFLLFSLITIIGPVSKDYLIVIESLLLIEVGFLIKYYLPKRLQK